VTKKAIERAQEHIADLSMAFSQSNCQRQYTELMAYLQALLDYQVISESEFRLFCNAANVGLASWTEPPYDPFT
jgi:hypothetical protein